MLTPSILGFLLLKGFTHEALHVSLNLFHALLHILYLIRQLSHGLVGVDLRGLLLGCGTRTEKLLKHFFYDINIIK